MTLKHWYSINNKEVVYKLRDNDKMGVISKTQPANKKEEIEDIKDNMGQKKTTEFPKRVKTANKKVMKLNTNYSKKEDDGSQRPGPVDKSVRPGKKYSQQMGRKRGKGAGHLTEDKSPWKEFLVLPKEEKEAYLANTERGHRPAMDIAEGETTRRMYEDMAGPSKPRIGKKYSQQPGRKAGKGAGKVVSKDSSKTEIDKLKNYLSGTGIKVDARIPDAQDIEDQPSLKNKLLANVYFKMSKYHPATVKKIMAKKGYKFDGGEGFTMDGEMDMDFVKKI